MSDNQQRSEIAMKTCPTCKETKEDTDYYQNPTNGKLDAYCRPCRKLRERARAVNQREEALARSRKWAKANPSKRREVTYKWRQANPEKLQAINQRWSEEHRNEWTAGYRSKIRNEVYMAYGGFRCVCCGETEPMFLTIDHIDNDGAKQRKELASKMGRGGSSFFAWLRRNKFPPGFQVLCRNCNWGKHANGGVCPHRDLERSTTRAAARSSEAIAERNAKRPELTSETVI